MPTTPTRWYQTTTGILLAGFIGVVGVILVTFVVLTVRYTWLIKHGSGDKIAASVDSSFTALAGANGVATHKISRADLEVSTAPILGNANAPITIVEFVDFKCPNCKLAAPIINQIVSAYPKGIKVLIRHFPIESLHPGASRLSLFVECANRQGKFWPAYNYIYANQETLSVELNDQELVSFATTLLLDQNKLATCMNSASATSAVTKDYTTALQAGVRGTPTFFVNGEKWEGVIPFETWKEYIESNK